MKHFLGKSWFLKISSLVIAILIVIYIDNSQTGYVDSMQSNVTRQTATDVQTVKANLQVLIDTDKYYVVGYPEKVNLTVEGPSALVTSALNTQTFRIYIDLSNLKVGRHTVKVQVSGLSKQISYYVKPAEITVNIQQRKSTTLPVQIEYNKNAVAKGYDVGSPSVVPAKVDVTGARSEVDQINQVVARVNIPSGLNRTYERQVLLVAEDKKGRPLNVVLTPATARIILPVSLTKKQVKVSLKPTNEAADKVYTLSTKTKQVTIYGRKAVVNRLRSVAVKVDLAHVLSSTSVNVPITVPVGVAYAAPTNLAVNVKVRATGAQKND
ncbi:MAG: hypothetical protein L0I02_05070 [Lactobacillus sp.]|nr:hypothetical protein [Lactobacillus sp.]MDN6052034.1 hypothetical protein [Lactobacillus sp.]